MTTKHHHHKKEDWMNSKWRPMMGWSYMVTCIADFIIFPILWSVLQAVQHGNVSSQWNPITLQGAGLYHLAMGAVLGVAAWSRGQEKIAGASSFSTSVGSPSPFQNQQQISTFSSEKIVDTVTPVNQINKPARPVVKKPTVTNSNPDSVLDRD
jgi:hypothetical protein